MAWALSYIRVERASPVLEQESGQHRHIHFNPLDCGYDVSSGLSFCLDFPEVIA